MSFDVQTELTQLRGIVERMEQMLADRLPAKPEPILQDLNVPEFAAKVKRSVDWVYDEIRLRRIKVLPGGKPYRIPPSELQRFFQPGRN